ncbi:dihydropteroate synthase [Paenibacillus hexagrammi]|uniref:Dihydropteroate synthase n=1 Tax=Paenibacillus hexagrammi TaxID=2908839 RepID=A0ABY3SHA5_9BACL|nr:dihydropteroate synthase [Paenibacillus sp. YPD9-1]UJF33094.1 dihydropteroate synthase [Paenibacillus sp. YPD9-1]
MNPLRCKNRELPLGERTTIMGILNVTPDSFSDGGSYLSIEKALEQAKLMAAEGADILDIGGESTRPGFAAVPLEEELNRVIPIIQALKKELSLPISIDTYKSEVARQALEAGAHIINDVWGGLADPQMVKVAAEYDCPFIITHNRKNMEYNDFLADVLDDLGTSVRYALQAGVREERIILDPGIGFAKTYEQNLWLMNRLEAIVAMGYPVLLGTSRKSMIQKTLNLPPQDVVEGTAATVTLGISKGCHIVRVHDVQAMKRVAVMTDAMVRT